MNEYKYEINPHTGKLQKVISDTYLDVNYSKILKEDTIVNLDSSMTSAEIQVIIDAQPRNLNKYNLTFQFADGTYTLDTVLTFNKFHGNGQLYIYGNRIDENSSSLHTNQAVHLNFSTAIINSYGLYISNCNLVYIKSLKITIPSKGRAIVNTNTRRPFVDGCYILGSSIGNTNYGITAVNSNNVRFRYNYFSTLNIAILASNSTVHSRQNESIGDNNYGLFSNDGAIITKCQNQPSGTITYERINNGGMITAGGFKDNAIGNAVNNSHSQNTDIKLDEGGVNEVNAEEIKASVGLIETTTVNLDSSMTTPEIQALIDAQPKNLNGHYLYFQFADGTYNLTDKLYFLNFRNGQIRIQGNTSEMLLIHTTQAVIIKDSGFFIGNCQRVRVRQIAFSNPSYSLYITDIQERVDIRANYFTSSHPNKCVHITNTPSGEVKGNYFSGGLHGLRVTESSIRSVDNDSTGTLPTYALTAENGSIILKDGTQPSGLTLNENVLGGSIITEGNFKDGELKEAVDLRHTQNTDIALRIDKLTVDVDGNTDIVGDIKIKVYIQETEPTLSADQRMSIWEDNSVSGASQIYLIYRIGEGNQVKVALN